MLSTLAALATAITLSATSAAPPGMNAYYSSENFQFHGTEATAATVAKLAPQAEARLARLCARIGACDVLTRPMDIYIAEDAEKFASAFPDESPMAEWAVGVAFPSAYRIVLRAFGTAMFSLEETFDHEVSHILIHAVAKDTRLPRWFMEGIAIWHAGESVLQRLEAAQRAAITNSLLSLDDMDRRFPNRGAKVGLAYAQSALFVRYIAREHGEDSIRRLLKELRNGKPTFYVAFQTTFGTTPNQMAQRWQRQFEASTTVWSVLRDGTIIWVAMVFLFLWAYIVRRRQRREALAAMPDGDVVEGRAEEVWDDLSKARAQGEAPTLH